MPRARKKSVKKIKKKNKKGIKVFLILFGLIFLTVLLYQVVGALNKALTEAKSIQVVTDGEWGTPGDGPGQFREPQAVATDAQGNFYVSDFSGHRVQKFDSNGSPLLSIGKEGKEEGEFEQPSGLFIDGQGNIYVCDTFNHRIQKFDTDGNFVKAWTHSFFGPRSIVGWNNQYYVSDTGNHKIQEFDAEGNFIREWGGMGTTDGKFREPVGITADSQGNIYVADSDNERIQKFDSNGKFLASFKIPTWKGKNDEVPYLAFGQGFLWASNSSQNAVLELDPKGGLIAICRKNNKDIKKDRDGFSRVAGIAIDPQGRIYAVEKGFGKIARFTLPLVPATK